MTEKLLIRQLKARDAKAFEYLYRNYSESLQGVIFSVIRDKEVTKEVLQDVFLKIWNSIESHDSGKGRLFTWMLRIARNTSIDVLRSKDFGNQKKNLSDNFFVDILETNDRIDAKIDAQRMKTYVDKLKDKCQQLIDLLYFKGFTQKEASETLDIPVGTVKTRNRSCLSKLRELIPESYGR